MDFQTEIPKYFINQRKYAYGNSRIGTNIFKKNYFKDIVN